MNDSVREALSGQKVYDELVTVRTDENGNVTMIQADAVRMNELATMTALLAQEELAHAEHETVTIPLGAALGIPFFAALGPGVQVRLVPVGAVTAEFLSEFESAGINQTRHKIFLSMRTTVRLVLPRGAEQVSFNSQVLIAESIIVGQVPDSFIEVQSSDQALNFASHTAAITVSRMGAMPSLPTLDEVILLLKDREYDGFDLSVLDVLK